MLKPASTEIVPRCPAVALSARFTTVRDIHGKDDPRRPVRCVLGDDHSGRCKTIDGAELTADAHHPRLRYALMGLPPREGLPPMVLSGIAVAGAAERLAAFWDAFDRASDPADRAGLAAAFLEGR